MFALKIYKDGVKVFTKTTRTGLVVNEATLEIESGADEFAGMEYVLFDIKNQKELRGGVIDKYPADEIIPDGVNRF